MNTATALLLTLCLSDVSIWAEMTPYSDICAEVGELRAMVENQLALSESKARARETLVKDLKAELEVTKMELLRYKQQAEKMLKQLADEPKVAFSATLTKSVRPFNAGTTLVFPKTFTNTGNAYDVSTGVFTAPVSGVYFFRYTVVDLQQNEKMSVQLHKNNKSVLISYTMSDSLKYEQLSNGVILELFQGDVVSLYLSANYGVTDFDDFHYNIFSGFLLYPM